MIDKIKAEFGINELVIEMEPKEIETQTLQKKPKMKSQY